MGQLETAAIARRAGVGEGFVRRLTELGLVPTDPAGHVDESHVRRIQLLEVLDARGLSLDGLATMVRGNVYTLEFLDAATYNAFSPLTDETFARVSERTSIPLELVLSVREATGGTRATADDLVREDELAIIPLVEFQFNQGFRALAIERGLRVYGESLRRIAESEGEWWRS